MTTSMLTNVPGTVTPLATRDKARSPLGMALRRFQKNRLALLSLVIVLFTAYIAIAADSLVPFDPSGQNMQSGMQDAPSGVVDSATGKVHVAGTDVLGRDLFSRLMIGTRVSLTVPIVTEAIVVLIGLPLGLLAGFYGGLVDDLIMRFTDIMYAFPGLLLVIILSTALGANGRSIFIISFALGIASWPTMARLVRGQVLQVKQMDFVLSARSIGSNSLGLMVRHIIPNVLGSVIVLVTLDFPADIIAEATLSFLGLGIDPSIPAWGGMINLAFPGVYSHPSEVVYPAIAIAILTLAFSFIGDGMRDAFDPRSK